MSGGPVFNDNGELCGLICASMDANRKGAEHLSYVSSLWPSMSILLDLDRRGHAPGTRYPAIELAIGGQISARNWERVKIVVNKNGERVGVAIK